MRKIAQKLMISVFAVAFAIIALGTSTFAWFTLSNQAQIGQFDIQVKGGEGFEIQAVAKDATPTADGWRVGTIPGSVIAAIVEQAYVVLDGITYVKGTNTFQQWDQGVVTTPIRFDPNGQRADTPNKYLEFDIYFRAPEGTTGSINLTNTTTMTAVGTSPWPADQAYNLTSNPEVRVVNGSTITYDISSAARISFFNGNANSTTIFEKAAVTGSDSLAGNSEGFTSATLGSAQYYAAKTAYEWQADDIPTIEESYRTTGYLGAANWAAVGYPLVTWPTTATDGFVTAKVTVGIWLEGWDGEMMNAILGASLRVSLGFALQEPTA